MGGGFTIEGWINPSVIDVKRPIAEWNNGSVWGVHFWVSVELGYGTGPGCLYVNIQDTNGSGTASYHTLVSAPGVVQANVYQHVAFTYDRISGWAAIYLNGTNVAQQNLGTNFTPQTSYDFYLGARVSSTDRWAGSLDEMSLYNRALSSNEIAAIYLAGSGGKCFTPTAPTITSEPTNQTVVVGQTATLSVTATGTPPLSYQWGFDTTNMAGATNAILVLPDVQPTNAGVYAVVVGNLAGSMPSSNAVLTVNPPPVLGLTQSGGFILVFWPVSAPGFVLETSSSLSPADWTPVPDPPIQIGGEYLESIQITGTNQFYRLQLYNQ